MALQKLLVFCLGVGWCEEVGLSSACDGLEALVREGAERQLEGSQGRVGSVGLFRTCASWTKKTVEWRKLGSRSPGQPQGEQGDR